MYQKRMIDMSNVATAATAAAVVPCNDKYDAMVLADRKQSTETYRLDAFCKMIQKHSLGRCECKKKGKICDYTIGPLLKYREAYLSGTDSGNKAVEENLVTLETMYNLSMSTSQSFRSNVGRELENSIEDVFRANGLQKTIHYATQVNVDLETGKFSNRVKGKNMHRIDFVIPNPMIGTNVSDFTGIVISVKTTTRERIYQDKFLGKFVLITLEDFTTSDPDITVVTIKPHSNQLTEFMTKIKNDAELFAHTPQITPPIELT